MFAAIFRAVIIFSCFGILFGFLNQCELSNGIHLRRPLRGALLKGAIVGALLGLLFGFMGFYLH